VLWTQSTTNITYTEVEEAVQNGVKDTKGTKYRNRHFVEETIQNGVKEINEVTDFSISSEIFKVKCKKTIKEGVKNTLYKKNEGCYGLEETIQDGVKYTTTEEVDCMIQVKDTIQNGVKETKEFKQDRNSSHGIFKMVDEMPTHIPMVQVQDVIQEGVKETKTVEDGDIIGSICFMNDNNTTNVRHLISDVVQNGVKHTIAENPYAWRNVEGVIENGIKEVIELPELNPDLNGYGEYYSRNKNMKYPFNDIVEDVIKENNKLS